MGPFADTDRRMPRLRTHTDTVILDGNQNTPTRDLFVILPDCTNLHQFQGDNDIPAIVSGRDPMIHRVVE